MKKLGLLVVVLVGLAAILYSGAWFYYAKQIEQTFLAHKNFRFTDQSIKQHFSFDKVEVTGFPLAFEISLTNPAYKMGLASGHGSEILLDRLTLKTNMIGTHFQVTLGSTMENIMREGEVTKRFTTITQGNQQFSLQLKPQKNKEFPWIISPLPRHMDRLLERFESLHYSSGPQAYLDETGAWISKVGEASIHISNQMAREALLFDVDVNIRDVEVNDPKQINLWGDERIKQLFSHYYQFGTFNVAMDFSYKGPASLQKLDQIGLQLNLAKWEMEFDQFGFQASGKISQHSDVTNPVGSIEITLTQFDKGVDGILDVLALQPAFAPKSKLINYSKDQRQMIKQFIRSISLEPQSKGPDAVIRISRKAGEQPKVSHLTIPDILAKWQQLAIALQ